MNKDSQANPFREAYDKASSELLKVIHEFESLRLQREHVEKVVNVLKPAAGVEEMAETTLKTPATERSGFTVLTHVNVVRIPRKA
jgi:hypothetical protein